MTNVVTSYLQLKAVFLALMVSDASDAAGRLRLAEALPIRRENVCLASVHDPVAVPQMGLGGVFETTNWVYSYPRSGKLAYVIRKNPNFWRKADPERYRPYAVPESALDTNAARQVALQWLGALSVDLDRLSRECVAKIQVTRILGMAIPEYAVSWSSKGETVASVWFLDPGRQLWQLRVEDPSYLLRPSITNQVALKPWRPDS